MYKLITTCLIIIIFTYSHSIYAAGISSKYINIVIDDDFYFPANQLINEFVLRHDIIVNSKYVNYSFYLNELQFNDKLNIFITKKNNQALIERFFIIKNSSNSLGYSSFCLCFINKDSINTIEGLSNSNKFFNLILGGTDSSFYIGSLFSIKDLFSLKNHKITKIYFKDSLGAIQSLLKNNLISNEEIDIGVFPMQMCPQHKQLQALKLNSINEYSIFVTNYLNQDIQLFLDFFKSDETIKILNNYGISLKEKQFTIY